jgi:fucose 4-O-acetylase-like acetyltransferase
VAVPNITIAFGIALCVLGEGGYWLTGAKSPTALIPVAFGVLLMLCGILGRKESRLKHAMHAAAVLALVGFLFSAPGLVKLPALVSGGYVAYPNAVIAQSIMSILLLVFLGLCVRSFIAAKRLRKANAAL